MADAGRPTIVAGLVARAIHTAVSCGLERGALLAELEIDPAALEDRDNRLPVETFARTWNLMSARLPDRVLALDWITSWKVTDAGVLGYVLLQLQTVEDAMQASVRYAHLINQGAQARLRKGSPTSRMGFELAPVLLATQHVAETMMASLTLFLRGVVGQSFAPLAVRFPHASTSRTAALERYFGAPVLHEASEISIEIPNEILARPLPNADPVLGGYLRKQADLLVERVAAPKAVSRECARRIAERLGSGEPSQTAIARQMGMSERTLQRRLQAEGTTFNELLDDARRTIAFSYLADRKLAAYEVSFLLGYAEPATFFRAFKRWTGQTPQQYRATAMNA
jgi:AraC-like DNA-binding protein